MIIAVDDSFVVPIPTTMKAVGFFHLGSNAVIAPELRADLARRLGNAPNAWNGVAVGANGKPGLLLNAPDEKAAIEGALTDCGRQDRNCRVIALGPFSVEPLLSSKSVDGSPLPPTKVGPAQKQSALLLPETIPFVRDVDRAAIRSEYLPAPEHKALAISLNRSGFITGQPDDETAKTAALASCTRATEASGAKDRCEIYAVGNNVVFAGGNPPMPPPPWRVRNPAIERPFASKDLPLVGDGGRAFWEKTYPTAGKSKALALAPRGLGWSSFYGVSPEEAIRTALEACGYRSGVACMIVAVDDSFVVPIPTTMKAVGFFLPGSDAAIAPELRADFAQRLGNAPNAWNGVAVGANGKPGLMLNAPSEQAAIEGALTDCGRQDRNCRVIALGPFSVEPLSPSKSVEGSPLPPANVGPAQRGSPQAPLPPITVAPTPNLRPQ